jgi:hypothetical protein
MKFIPGWARKDVREVTIDSIIDDLARFILVMRSDHQLQYWFRDLEKKPLLQRHNDIQTLARQLAAENRDADLVASFKLLSNSRVFDAVSLALRECADNEDK